ncbi:MAG: acyl-CoA dehydrogenase family protein [Proteobacteria bacterium]|nr:acyl-CoA dehydrogenase family protein [Pseudomonadota bacterium]
MVDFSISEKDQQIFDLMKKEGLVRRKYSRYYDLHEEEIPPDEFPEAKDFPSLESVLAGRSKEEGGATAFSLFASMHRAMYGGIALRSPNRALGNSSLTAAGTDEQKKKWGNTRLAMANTEPGCGSDSKAIETTAVLDGDEWVLNGEKIFVTTGIKAEGVVIWATVDKAAGRAGIKAFVVMKGTPGLELVKKEKKLGIRASDTAAFVLKDCRIPRENLLGLDESVVKKGGGGFKGLMMTFNLTRPGVAAGGIGNTMSALEFVKEELEKEGVTVNYELGQHNRTAIQQKVIELEAELEAATLATLRAGWLGDEGKPNNLEASVSKQKGGDICRKGTQLALEILGAPGITRDYRVEQNFRDGRITDIYEGTGEIQRLVIARGILNYSAADLS